MRAGAEDAGWAPGAVRCDDDSTASVIRRVIEHSAADGAPNELLNLIEVFYGD